MLTIVLLLPTALGGLVPRLTSVLVLEQEMLVSVPRLEMLASLKIYPLTDRFQLIVASPVPEILH